jgi:hypothetical protein
MLKILNVIKNILNKSHIKKWSQRTLSNKNKTLLIKEIRQIINLISGQ